MYECSDRDLIIRLSQRKIKTISNDIKEIDAALMKYILTDEKMRFNYFILISIKGIGMVNALMTIVFTENFTSFPSAKAYAVYAGVVPFDQVLNNVKYKLILRMFSLVKRGENYVENYQNAA